MPGIDRSIMKNITLLQRFSILSLMSLVFASIAFGWIITYILEQDIILRSRELTAKIVSEEAGKEFSIAELVTPKISDYDEFSEKDEVME